MNLYLDRLKHYAPVGVFYLPDLKSTKGLSPKQVKEKEGEQILAKIAESDHLILLDEKGKTFTSVEFSDFLNKKMSTLQGDLVFLVGGPYGFSEEVYKRAAGKISLSSMTFSHQIIRLIFLEQLYRAFTILKGEPYHHE